jgi:hypothetical protein
MPLGPYLRQVTGLVVVGFVAYLGDDAPYGDVTHAVVILVALTVPTEVPPIGKRYWLGGQARVPASLRPRASASTPNPSSSSPTPTETAALAQGEISDSADATHGRRIPVE